LIFIENKSCSLLARKMEPSEIEEIPALNIEKAIKAVQNYIKELEDQKTEGLTDKQTQALNKFTQESLSQNEAET